MKIQNIIGVVLNLILFVSLQVLVFRNIALFDLAFCFFYVGFILLIPQEFPVLITMLLGLLVGFCVDLFYDTMGIHMASCVLIAYLRPYVIHFLTPRGGYDANSELSITYMGFQWFLTYAAILIFVHHLALFIIESWSFGIMTRLLIKAVMSTIFTLFVVILFQYLISPAKKQ